MLQQSDSANEYPQLPYEFRLNNADAISEESVGFCPVCGSCQNQFYASGYDYELQTCSNLWKFVKCSVCDHVWLNPRPAISELSKIYPPHYYAYNYAAKISPIAVKAKMWMDEGKMRKILRTLNHKPSSFLDIGCGEGFFLEEAQNRGWKVFGTEFAEKYISICKEKHIEMHYGKLNPDHYSEGFFDVITWFEVIEHINYPVDELKNIHRLLRKNGALYITTPNFNALSRHWLKGKWSVIEYPEHLAYYTPRTLRNILKKAGFSSIRIKTTGISPGRITQSVGRLSNETFHDVDRVWQQQLEKNNGMKLLKSVVNWFLNLTGTGDSMKALFRKSS